MKTFNLHQYPDFIKLWNNIGGTFTGDEFLRKKGFKSANYNRLEKWWGMDDNDFYIFHLLWSDQLFTK